MSHFEVTRYRDNMPSVVAGQLSDIFVHNYPEQHSAKDRCEDIRERSGAAAIQSLLQNGRTFYVGRMTPDTGRIAPVGFLEARTVNDIDPNSDGVYEQLVWVMTDHRHRGLGLAEMLHGMFLTDADERARQRLPRPTKALLSVHEQNPAIRLYRRWGYSVLRATNMSNDGKIFMEKKLPLNTQD